MRPDQCGTRGVPADHPARAEVDRFAAFLADAKQMDPDAFAEKWGAYMRGEGTDE